CGTRSGNRRPWRRSAGDPHGCRAAKASRPFADDPREATMSAPDEAVVRRFYEQMNNERKNELAPELFTADHRMHDPQVPAPDGPDGMVATVSVYQQGVDGHWGIEDIFSSGDKVVVRWTGSGTHVGEMNGIPPTGKKIAVDAISA